MKIFAREKDGDNNLEIELTGRDATEGFQAYVQRLREDGGYITTNPGGRRVFVPWHNIDYIEER